MLPWYREGTVAVTNGSPSVVGTNTFFTENSKVGDVFIGPDGEWYEITLVSDDTNIQVKQKDGTAAYAGGTASAQGYAVIRNFTNSTTADLAARLTTLVNSHQSFNDEINDWLAGTAGGGTNSDGKYPLTDSTGTTKQVACPAQIEADILAINDLRTSMMSEAEYRALQKMWLEELVGSGFVEFGKNYEGAGYDNVNYGITTAESFGYSFRMGRLGSSPVGPSKTLHAVANINGANVNLLDGASAFWGMQIDLPDAPDAVVSTDGTAPAGLEQGDFTVHGNIIYCLIAASYATGEDLATSGNFETRKSVTRVDHVRIEYDEIPVSTYGMVYPNGLPQSLLATDPATGLTTVAGDFAGADTLSLFGPWQENGARIGKGLVWNDLSDTNKRKFAAANNLFIRASDNEVIMPVVFARVHKGVTLGRYGMDDTTIKAQGAATVPTANSFVQDSVDVGLFSAGTVKAVEVCHVLRNLNQGAYHWKSNPYGTFLIRNSANTASVKCWENVGALTSVSDCFDLTGGADKPVATTGHIASGSSGHPEGLYYDAVYQHDIEDLRTSARKVGDKQQYAKDQLVALKDSQKRGLEKVTMTKFIPRTVTVGGTASWGSSSGGRIIFATSDSDNPRDVTTAEFSGLGRVALHIVGDNGEAMTIPTVPGSNDFIYWPYTSNTAYLYGVADVAAEFNAKFPIGTKLMIGAQYEAEVESANDIGRSALICDPKNCYRGHYDFLSSDGVQTVNTGDVIKLAVGYEGITNPGVAGHFYKRLSGGFTTDLSQVTSYGLPADWQDLGPDREDSWLSDDAELPFEWLGVAEDGSSLIPDGTSKAYKMPHQCDTCHLVLYSDNGGNTWGINTSGWAGLLELKTNSRTSAEPSGRLNLIFYTSKANPLQPYQTPDSTIAELLQVIASDSSRLVDYTTDKVAVGADEETAIVLHEKDGVYRHHPVDLDGTGPAAKFHAALVALNGKHHLELRAKEMVYDLALDNTGDFISVDGATFANYIAGNYYRLSNMDNDMVVYCLVDTPYKISTSTLLDNGYFADNDGSHIFKLWDGNGWGDDNTLDSTATTTDTDDNGQVIKQGRYLVELDTFAN